MSKGGAVNILITGGSGFIGSRLTLKLLERGHQVRVLDKLSPQIHTCKPEGSPLFMSIEGKVDFIHGDVTDKATLQQALEGQHAVVHLAAETGTGQSMYQIDLYSRVNIGGTSLLLDILANDNPGIERVVLGSSRSVYGEGKYQSAELGTVYPEHRSLEDMQAGNFEVKYPGCEGPLKVQATDEESKIHPTSVYGITKQCQEQLVMTVCPSIGVEAVVLRYQNVFGPGQALSNPYTGILSIFSNLIMKGEPVNIFEDGLESRDFVYIDDVVDATILGIEHGDAANEIFNVGTGTPIDVLSVAKTLSEKLGKPIDYVITGDFRLGDIRHNYADIARINRLLGFKPQFDFETGITHFCNWVRESGVRDSGYQDSIAAMKQKGLMKAMLN